MEEKIIILRECQGSLSIMKHDNSDGFLTFETADDALEHIQKRIDQFVITDKFFIVEHISEAEMSEKVERSVVVTRYGISQKKGVEPNVD